MEAGEKEMRGPLGGTLKLKFTTPAWSIKALVTWFETRARGPERIMNGVFPRDVQTKQRWVRVGGRIQACLRFSAANYRGR